MLLLCRETERETGKANATRSKEQARGGDFTGIDASKPVNKYEMMNVKTIQATKEWAWAGDGKASSATQNSRPQQEGPVYKYDMLNVKQ